MRNYFTTKKVINFSYCLLLSGLTLLFAGCTGMNSEFGCNKTAGDSCSPVEQINADAVAGVYNRSSAGSAHSYQNFLNQRGGKTSSLLSQGIHSWVGKPVRYREAIQRVWIGPFEDRAGNYHEPSYIYTILKGSHWAGVSENTINASVSHLG